MSTSVILTTADKVLNAEIYYVKDFEFLRLFFAGRDWIGPAYSGLDIETENVLSPHLGEIACIQIELHGKCFVVHWDWDKTLTTVPHVDMFRAYLESNKVKKVIHNAKFEMVFFLHAFGDHLDCTNILDTMAGEYILAEGGADEEMGFMRVPLDLGSTVERRYGHVMDKDKELRTSFRRRGVVNVTPAKLTGTPPTCSHTSGCVEQAGVYVGARGGAPACFAHECDKAVFKSTLKRVVINEEDYEPSYETVHDLTDRQLKYAAFDSLWAAQVLQDQIEEMTQLEFNGGENYLTLLTLDSKTAEVIASMELLGIPVNRERLQCLDAEWQCLVEELNEYITDKLCFTNVLPLLLAPRWVEQTDANGVVERLNMNSAFAGLTEEDLPTALGYFKEPSKAALKKAKEAGEQPPVAKFVEAKDFPKISSGEQMVPRLQALGYAITSYESHELKHYKGDPLIDAILQQKMISKLQTTYTDGFLSRVNSATGRVHGSFNQFRTSTGRLAGTDPNLQNLPAKSKEGGEMRACVQVRDDRVTCLIIVDYSQLELRQIAQTYNDANMRDAFRNGLDLHSLFASKMTGIPYEEIEAEKDGKYKKLRAQAKPANFGLGYGAGVDMFMFIAWSQYGIIFTREEATNLRAMWLNMYPGVAAKHNETKSMIKNGSGMVKARTWLGRTRRMPRVWTDKDGNRKTAYAAVLNHPIQGTGGDGVKLAMVALRPLLKPYDAHLILQVHDELVVECPVQFAQEVKLIMEREMISAMQPFLPDVPCLVDGKISSTWCK